MEIKTKIYLTLVVWLAVCGAMFLFGFKILQASNKLALGKISEQKNQMLALEAQAENYRLEQEDLENMQKQKMKPQDFFSQDITLVQEIETLENLGKKMNVDLSLSGIAGTITSIAKAPTKSQLFVVPISVSVSGSLSNVTDFIETLENLDYITTPHSLNVSTAGSGEVNSSLSVTLYIRNHQ